MILESDVSMFDTLNHDIRGKINGKHAIKALKKSAVIIKIANYQSLQFYKLLGCKGVVIICAYRCKTTLEICS